jgi:hypothetical protein
MVTETIFPSGRARAPTSRFAGLSREIAFTGGAPPGADNAYLISVPLHDSQSRPPAASAGRGSNGSAPELRLRCRLLEFTRARGTFGFRRHLIRGCHVAPSRLSSTLVDTRHHPSGWRRRSPLRRRPDPRLPTDGHRRCFGTGVVASRTPASLWFSSCRPPETGIWHRAPALAPRASACRTEGTSCPKTRRCIVESFDLRIDRALRTLQGLCFPGAIVPVPAAESNTES